MSTYSTTWANKLGVEREIWTLAWYKSSNGFRDRPLEPLEYFYSNWIFFVRPYPRQQHFKSFYFLKGMITCKCGKNLKFHFFIWCFNTESNYELSVTRALLYHLTIEAFKSGNRKIWTFIIDLIYRHLSLQALCRELTYRYRPLCLPLHHIPILSIRLWGEYFEMNSFLPYTVKLDNLVADSGNCPW